MQQYKDRIEAYSEKGYQCPCVWRYEGILDGQQLTEKAIADRVYHADKCDPGRSKGNLFLFYRAWCGDQGYLRDNPKTVAEIAEKRESVAQITMWMLHVDNR